MWIDAEEARNIANNAIIINTDVIIRDIMTKVEDAAKAGKCKANFAFLHKSAWKNIPQLAWHHEPTTDAELRAMTPPGFAWEFYEANKEVNG